MVVYPLKVNIFGQICQSLLKNIKTLYDFKLKFMKIKTNSSLFHGSISGFCSSNIHYPEFVLQIYFSVNFLTFQLTSKRENKCDNYVTYFKCYVTFSD